MAVARSKGQRSRSHGYENRHCRTVASDHVPYSAYQYAAVLPAAVAGVSLLVDTTACILVTHAQSRELRLSPRRLYSRQHG